MIVGYASCATVLHRDETGKISALQAVTIDLVVGIGSRVTCVGFVVCERLATGVVLGCGFIDRFVGT